MLFSLCSVHVAQLYGVILVVHNHISLCPKALNPRTGKLDCTTFKLLWPRLRLVEINMSHFTMESLI